MGLFSIMTPSSQADIVNNGLINGKLKPCPDSPNCVSSESSMISPIKLSSTDLPLEWTLLQQVIKEQGGEIQEITSNYLLATFTSTIFGFIDDVEARIDQDEKVIHLRSASRTGYYDFGANNKRLQEIKKNIQLKQYGSAESSPKE